MAEADVLSYQVYKIKKILEINTYKTFLTKTSLNILLQKFILTIIQSRYKIQDIIERISFYQEITLQEKILVEIIQKSSPTRTLLKRMSS